MFYKSRLQEEANRRSYEAAQAGDGTFIYQGVEGSFTLMYTGNPSSRQVKAYIGYHKDDVPWTQRSTFEYNLLNYLKDELDDYRIIEYTFTYRR